jgi:hypothetical protein
MKNIVDCCLFGSFRVNEELSKLRIRSKSYTCRQVYDMIISLHVPELNVSFQRGSMHVAEVQNMPLK